MTEPGTQPLNLDPIEVITQRRLPDGTLEAQLRLSERDWERLIVNPHETRYSIESSAPVRYVDGRTMIFDGGPVGEAAEMGKDIENVVSTRIEAATLGARFPALPVEQPKPCGATTVFWPDVEACEATCMLPIDHPGTTHEDETLGAWSEDELPTNLPDERL